VAAEDYTLEEAADHIAGVRGQVDQLNEVHPLNSTTPPQAVAGSAQLYASNGQPSWVGPSGLQMGVVGAQQAFTPSNTVTAASLTNLAQGTIPAGDAEANAVYEMEVWGNGTQGTVGNRQTLQFAAVLGGTTMSSVTFGTIALPDTQAIFRWRAVGRFICLAPGAGATWQSFILVTLSQFNVNYSQGNQSENQAFSCESTGTTVKDSTIGNNAGVYAAWGGASSGCTITSQVAIFKRIC
jgi:hypothetical protein